MKSLLVTILVLSVASMAFAGGYGLQGSHVTDRQSGTIMISGAGFYQTDLGAELKSSLLSINSDIALFLAPVLAIGVDIGWVNDFEERYNIGGTDEFKETILRLGPRGYFFMGGRHSELTPFIKGGANYVTLRSYENDEITFEAKAELGLTASLGLLLNLARNVGISVEAEYNFEKGTNVDEIDTEQLFLKFGIRSFLGE